MTTPSSHTRRTGTAPFWSLLDESARTELSRVGRIGTFAARAQLLRQNEISDHLLVVRSGCVKVSAHSADGYLAVLALRDPGDLLGEQAGLDGGPRSATLTALTRVEVLVVSARAFNAAADALPAITGARQQVLSARLREADRHRAAAGSEAVQARLAQLLLDLAGTYGRRTDSGSVQVALPLSQDDLAGLVLSSRRTVSRVFEQWRAAGWVSTGRNRLVIDDPDALKRQSGHP